MSTWDSLAGKVFIFFLLVFGLGVGLTSLYFSSLSGLMGKLGLVGGDLRQAVSANDLARSIYEVGTVPNCDFWGSIVPVPTYLFTRPEARIELGLKLAKLRVECGVVYTMEGNVDRGIYTMLKGLYYERTNHREMLKLVETDRVNCQLFDSSRSYGYVEAYLESSEGNTRESILSLYEEVSLLREKIAERCLAR